MNFNSCNFAKSSRFLKVSLLLSTTGEKSCGGTKKKKDGKKNEKQFDLLFLPIFSGHPPLFSLLFPLFALSPVLDESFLEG